MEDKHKHNLPKPMGKIEEAEPKSHKPFITAEEALKEQRKADAVRAANPKLFQPKPAPSPAPFQAPTGQMPPDEVPPVVAAKPDPKPVPNAPNVKKGEGITYIGKYKKFHAEFKASGQTYNVGMFDTEAQAVAAIATAKAHLYP